MKPVQRNPDLSIIYNAAILITNTVESAERLVASACASKRSHFGPADSDHRLKSIMRDVAAAAKKLTFGDSPAAPAAIVNPGFQVDRIGRSLRLLAFDQRAAVVLRDVMGFSTQDAADVTGTSPERFRQLLSQGRMVLTEVMN